MNVPCFVLCEQEALPSARRICPLFSASHWLYNCNIFCLLCSQFCGLEPDEQRGDHHERGEGGAGAARDDVRHGVLPASRRVRVVRMEECAEGTAVCGLKLVVVLMYILSPWLRYSVRLSVSGKNTNSYRCVSTTVLWTGGHLTHEPLTMTNHSETNYPSENLKGKWLLTSNFLIPFSILCLTRDFIRQGHAREKRKVYRATRTRSHAIDRG